MENISKDLTVVDDADSMFPEYTNKRTFSNTYVLDQYFGNSIVEEYNGIDNLYNNLKSNHSYYVNSVVYYSKNDLTTYDISSLDRSIYDSYTNYHFDRLFTIWYASIDRDYISFYFKDGVTMSNYSDIGYVHPNEVDMDLLCIIKFNIYTVVPFISMSVGNINIPVFKQNTTNNKTILDHTITIDEPIDFCISYEDSNDKGIIFYFPIKLNHLKNEIPSDMFINYININDVKLEPDRSLINQYKNFLYGLSYTDENDDPW